MLYLSFDKPKAKNFHAFPWREINMSSIITFSVIITIWFLIVKITTTLVPLIRFLRLHAKERDISFFTAVKLLRISMKLHAIDRTIKDPNFHAQFGSYERLVLDIEPEWYRLNEQVEKLLKKKDNPSPPK